LLFQTFDEKNKCAAIFANNKLYYKKFPKGLTRTWSYSEILKDRDDIEYAQLYCGGKTLNEVCPEPLKKEWDTMYNRLKAFYRSCLEADLDLSKHCFFDMTPESFLIDYAKNKNNISEYVFANYERPENYEFLTSLSKILTEIKYNKLNTDYSALNGKLAVPKVRRFIKKNKKLNQIKYNMFKTRTGRLATFPNSFPILTMDKTYRKILKPANDWFLEFDYNAAELRVMLGLLGKEQPKEDLHEWNMKNIYKKIKTREEAKKKIFAWLYNPELEDQLSNQIYNREELLEKYWDGNNVKTYFNREIKADKHHALNYIVQSTAADLFLQQMIKVWELLKGKKSKIAFCLHDSLIIDFSEEDQYVLNELKNTFVNTSLGRFKINAYAGRTYGEMKKLNIN